MFIVPLASFFLLKKTILFFINLLTCREHRNHGTHKECIEASRVHRGHSPSRRGWKESPRVLREKQAIEVNVQFVRLLSHPPDSSAHPGSEGSEVTIGSRSSFKHRPLVKK